MIYDVVIRCHDTSWHDTGMMRYGTIWHDVVWCNIDIRLLVYKMTRCMCTWTYCQTCTWLYVNIYIYIEREREGERERCVLWISWFTVELALSWHGMYAHAALGGTFYMSFHYSAFAKSLQVMRSTLCGTIFVFFNPPSPLRCLDSPHLSKPHQRETEKKTISHPSINKVSWVLTYSI